MKSTSGARPISANSYEKHSSNPSESAKKKVPRYSLQPVVVKKRDNGDWELIDGQQRLTTLAILLCVLKNNSQFRTDLSWFKKINISFEKNKIIFISNISIKILKKYNKINDI